MPGAILRVFTRLTLIVTGIGVCFASPENTSPNQRDTQSLVFLQEPPDIQYYVTRSHPANLTWVAVNVCRIQIRCNGRKFKDGRIRVCGKSCTCRTKAKTKIVTAADFPKDVRSITCKCKVWGKKGARQSDVIIIDKAFLGRNFSTVQLHYMSAPNTTVVLKCRPPNGSPRPNITWYKLGKPSLLLGHDGSRRIRLTSKKNLIIKRLQLGDSGEYQCVARNMAARRVGPVIKLDVGENISTAGCQGHQWPCTSQYSPECRNGSNRSLVCDSEPPMLMVGTPQGLYTTDLFNLSTWKRIEANIVSLDFGLAPNLIYWSDGTRINQFSMHNGVNKDMFFGHGDVISVEDLAVDWIGDKIYWIDAMRDGIHIGDLKSGRRVKIIDKNLDSPRAIVVSPTEGYMYWTDWGRMPKIERARLDGSERRVFISNVIQIPNGLALDESNKKLYWVGKDLNGYGIIEVVSLDGLNRKVIFRRSGYHPFSLDIFQDFVYWSDWEKNAVLRINKTGGGGDEVIVSGLNKPMELKILHRRKETDGLNPCEKSNGGCEHLCVYLPFLGRRCLCEQNFKLSANGKTCDKLELRGENRNKSGPNSPTDPSLVVTLLIAILLLAVLGLFIFLLKKRCRPCQTSQDLTKRSTNPDDIHEVGDESLELTDQTELGRAVPDSNNESSNLIGQDSGEPSGSVPACGDSSVTSQTVLVYVEQHGGVTVVGDDAKIHNYSPQS